MADVRLILVNIRKIIVATLWMVVFVMLVFLDNATIGAISRAISELAGTVGNQPLDKILSMAVMPSSIVMQYFGALRISALLLKLASMMIIAMPLVLVIIVAVVCFKMFTARVTLNFVGGDKVSIVKMFIFY